VDATIVQVGGAADAGAFAVGAVLTNNADRPLQLRAPRLEPPVYTVISTPDPGPVAGGTSAQVNLRLEATCPVPTGTRFRLVVPVVPASGRVRELAVDIEPSVLDDLAHRACGEIPAFEAAGISATYNSASQYGVAFGMTVTNGSNGPFALLEVSSPGLAVGVRGGTPVRIEAHGRLDLQVEVALPACSRLPPPPGRVGVQRFGSFQLVLRDVDGRDQAAAYTPQPGDPLSLALLALRSRICPRGRT
jgi:hypothetical protein